MVIPVYNAERYLRQCLDSVLGQSLREIEVICVDDGSTDHSPDILREYEARDERMHVLCNSRNCHAGICRNLGLERAVGEYVLFMDADDWIIEDGLRAVYTQAHRLRADVLRCKSLDYDNQTGTSSVSLHNGLKRVPFFLYGKPLRFRWIYWLLPKLNVAPWGGLCRREFLIDRNIRFNDLICVNDRSFYWETMLKADRIVLCSHAMICYRMNLSNSLVSNRIRNFDCHFKSYELVYELLKNCALPEKRCVLRAELLDMANWLETAAGTRWSDTVFVEMRLFIEKLDSSIWNRKTEKTKWHKRMILASNKR